MLEIAYRPRAVADLDGILVYLAIDVGSLQAADGIAHAILSAIERLAELPTIGRVFVDEGLNRDYRRFRVRNYWIYYSFDDDVLTVWRIFHTSRDTEGYGYHAFD